MVVAGSSTNLSICPEIRNKCENFTAQSVLRRYYERIQNLKIPPRKTCLLDRFCAKLETSPRGKHPDNFECLYITKCSPGMGSQPIPKVSYYFYIRRRGPLIANSTSQVCVRVDRILELTLRRFPDKSATGCNHQHGW